MGYPDYSILTDELPNTESSGDAEELGAIEGQINSYSTTMVPPKGGFKEDKPRWVNNRVAARPQLYGRPRREGLVCYACYGRHHLSIECTPPLKELRKLIENYESLKEEERARVLPEAYWRTKTWFTRASPESGNLVLHQGPPPTVATFPQQASSPGANTALPSEN